MKLLSLCITLLSFTSFVEGMESSVNLAFNDYAYNKPIEGYCFGCMQESQEFVLKGISYEDDIDVRMNYVPLGLMNGNLKSKGIVLLEELGALGCAESTTTELHKQFALALVKLSRDIDDKVQADWRTKVFEAEGTVVDSIICKYTPHIESRITINTSVGNNRFHRYVTTYNATEDRFEDNVELSIFEQIAA